MAILGSGSTKKLPVLRAIRRLLIKSLSSFLYSRSYLSALLYASTRRALRSLASFDRSAAHSTASFFRYARFFLSVSGTGGRLGGSFPPSATSGPFRFCPAASFFGSAFGLSAFGLSASFFAGCLSFGCSLAG
jgi:hypothetical protein